MRWIWLILAFLAAELLVCLASGCLAVHVHGAAPTPAPSPPELTPTQPAVPPVDPTTDGFDWWVA